MPVWGGRRWARAFPRNPLVLLLLMLLASDVVCRDGGWDRQSETISCRDWMHTMDLVGARGASGGRVREKWIPGQLGPLASMGQVSLTRGFVTQRQPASGNSARKQPVSSHQAGKTYLYSWHVNWWPTVSLFYERSLWSPLEGMPPIWRKLFWNTVIRQVFIVDHYVPLCRIKSSHGKAIQLKSLIWWSSPALWQSVIFTPLPWSYGFVSSLGRCCCTEVMYYDIRPFPTNQKACTVYNMPWCLFTA